MIKQQFTRQQLIAMLSWQVEMGADEAIFDQPTNGGMELSSIDIISSVTQQKTRMAITREPALHNGSSNKCLKHINSLENLAKELDQLKNCPLKHTASTLCFADGNAGSRLMIVGEVPGRDEDRVGVPFVGAAGQLLDRMMESIGLDRSGFYITNLLPWRPPGNRTPTNEEFDLLIPFLYRHIQIAEPEVVFILGGTPAKILLNRSYNIMKLRGIWYDIDYGDGVLRPTMASLHPSYLIRSPAQKRLAFDDLCQLHQRLAASAPLD